MKKVLIDVGHGGKDPGCSHGSLLEKDVVLGIAKETQKELLRNGVNVKLTRTTDVPLSLKQRSDMSKGYDLSVSIHINSSVNTNACGFQTYVYTKPSSESTRLATAVQNNCSPLLGQTKWTRVEKKDLHMVREPKCPSILTECGFMSNSVDRSRIATQTFQKALGISHAKGILEFLKVTPKEQVKSPEKHTSIVMYLQSVGQDSSFSNRSKLALKHGIKNYTGTAQQNITLLNILQG